MGRGGEVVFAVRLGTPFLSYGKLAFKYRTNL